MNYKRFGILICCASNGIMNVEHVKKLIDNMEKMGYNLLELCIDDIYKIDDEPYFGYLRGGYTKAEIQEMDAYAAAHGVELVPNIQTLAHLSRLVKLPHYYDIVDIDDILLVDEPKTYVLVEKMFAAIRECFSTNLVNIGMDEAHNIGLGKYLNRHGYVNRTELLLRHLHKVLELAEKYGFEAHMWSDMFFRLANNGQYYAYDKPVSKEAVEKVPKNVALCYWDYGEHPIKEEIFDGMFTAHEAFGRELWFAGGAWTWNGFAPFNNYSLYSMKPAMKQVRKHGVENVIITIWGNDGNECSYFSVLPSLYAIRQYADGNFDEEKIKQGFYDTFGLSFDDFMALDLPNKTSRNPECLRIENPCKSLLYNDCFLGWKDSALAQVEPIPYASYAKTLAQKGKNAGEFAYIFDMLSKLCAVLELKADLGLRTRAAYQAGDKAGLKALLPVYEEAAKRVEAFRQSYRTAWMKEYKPYGWDIQQIRLSGLSGRLLDGKERLEEYLSGKADRIPELEETILPYADWGLQYNLYRGSISVSSI